MHSFSLLFFSPLMQISNVKLCKSTQPEILVVYEKRVDAENKGEQRKSKQISRSLQVTI